MPTNWKNNRLDSFAKLKRGITYKGDDLVDFGGQPYINMKSFKRGGGFNPIGLKYFKGFYKESDIVTANDVLIVNTDVTDGEIIGLPLIIPDFLKDQNVLCSHHVTVLKIDANELIPEFLFRLLCLTDYRKEFRKYSRGTTVKMLDVSGIKNIIFSYPENIKEQRIIADILNTLDRAIAQTEALIAKHQRIKTGLMQDLLTRGIDEHGQLRDESTHKFKSTPLGMIPVEWEVKPLSSMASVEYGISSPLDRELETGVPIISLPNVSISGSLSLDNLPFVDSRLVKESDILQKGDILFNWRNGSIEHLGKTAYFDLDGIYTHVGFLLRVRAVSDVVTSRYLLYFLRFIHEQGFFKTSRIQVNNTFNSTELKTLLVRLPKDIKEQQRIADVLNQEIVIIDKEKLSLEKLQLLKTGLMQDLLSGEVLVTPLMEK